MIVLRVLDHVPPPDELVAMVVVLLVCEEVCLAQKLLLVKLELSHHLEGSSIEAQGRRFGCFQDGSTF